MIITTTLGPLESDGLIKIETTEPVPCGWSTTTQYKQSHDGPVIRQDVNIKVKEGIVTAGMAGQVQ